MRIVLFLILLIFFAFTTIKQELSAQNTVDYLKSFTSQLNNSKDRKAEWLIFANSHVLPFQEPEKITFFYFNESVKGLPFLRASFLEKDLQMNELSDSGIFSISVSKPPKFTGGSYSFIWYPNGVEQIESDIGNPWILEPYSNVSRLIVDGDPGSAYGRIANWKPKPKNGVQIQPRNVSFWVPPGYFSNLNKRYPVAYFHDGDNIWDTPDYHFGGWRIETAMLELLKSNEIPPMIFVGIANSDDRWEEYTGFEKFGSHLMTRQSLAIRSAYGHFIANEIKPWFDSHFRTLSDRLNTSIIGSSFGAAAAHFILDSYPQLFSVSIGISGSGFFPDQALRNVKPGSQLKIYLDSGTEGGDAGLVALNRDLAKNLLDRGFKDDREVFLRIIQDSEHQEPFWAERISDIFRLIWGKPKD